MGEKGGGNTPPDKDLRNIAIPLPELRKPVGDAIGEASYLYNRNRKAPQPYGPGVVQPWNDAQNAGYGAGVATAGNIGNILNPSASLVSRAGGGEFVGHTPGQATFDQYAGGGFVGNAPGQQLLNRAGSGEFVGYSPGQQFLNRAGSGEFVGNSPGQQFLNQAGSGAFVGNTPGQQTLNTIASGQFADPAANTLQALMQRAQGGSGGVGMIRGTASGQYLSGNPNLDALIANQSRDIKRDYGDAVAGLEGRMSQAGRLGSNAEMDLQGRAQQNLGQSLGDLENRTRYQDYANERGYQQQAQLALPGAFSTDIGTGVGAANAAGANNWQKLQAMLQGGQAAGNLYQNSLGQALSGAQAGGQLYQNSLGQALQGAQGAGNLYQNSMGQALQGAQAAGAGQRADQALQLQGAQGAAQTYQNSMGQALQGAGMAPGQAAAQFMGADKMLGYGSLQQGQGERQAAQNQEQLRYGQNQQWDNLNRYIQSLQGASGLTNQNAGAAAMPQPATHSTVGDLTSLLGAGAAVGGAFFPQGYQQQQQSPWTNQYW